MQTERAYASYVNARVRARRVRGSTPVLATAVRRMRVRGRRALNLGGVCRGGRRRRKGDVAPDQSQAADGLQLSHNRQAPAGCEEMPLT